MAAIIRDLNGMVNLKVKVVVTREFKWRMRVAVWLIGLAARVMNANIEVDEEIKEENAV